MKHQYKLLECASSTELNSMVTQHLSDEWDLWGNPFGLEGGFVEGEFGPAIKGIHYFQAVVRFDPSGHTVAGQIEMALREPAGYSMGIPTMSAEEVAENE